MSQFDVTKWNKQRYLAEANLLESTADLAASAINKAIDSVDESLSFKDFALAVAKILKDEYGSQNFGPFMDALKAELGIEESVNEAKDDFYPDSPEALRQATQTARDILDKYKDTIKKIADKYEGQPGKSRQMMDELNDLLDADLKGIPFEEYVSNKVRGVLGKALFRYYASKNPELSKLMK
jgi:hypothetical protein